MLQSDVAQNYFALRSLDAETAIVKSTVDLRPGGFGAQPV